MKVRTIITIGLLVLSIYPAGVNAQTPIPPLPADLLFTASLTSEPADYPRDVILRVDAKTLEVSPFYVDTEAYELLPLSWSPQGNLLAIYRRLPPIDTARTLFPRQLCIVDRVGILQQCMIDNPPMHYGGIPGYNWDYFPVAWGPDGQTIFFETEYPNPASASGYGRQVVEASVLTGETLRIVYDYPDPYSVALSPDLNHITVGFKGQYFGSGDPVFIHNLSTGAQFDASDRVPDHTWMNWACLPFSPSGQFIITKANYDVAEYTPDLEPSDDYRDGQGSLIVILDMEGTVQHIVGEPEGSPATTFYQECPGWQPDEQAIVFVAWNAMSRYIMRYSLADHQTTTLYEPNFEPGRESYVFSPLIPSPGGIHIALTVSDEPYGYGDRQVAVLYPDGEIYRIPPPYRFGLYPLWVPPLSSE